MTDGFIKLPRILMNYPELQEHDAFYVLYMLISLMRFREAYMDGVEIGVNQFSISKKELARRCGVELHRLKYILAAFERAGGIKMENNRNKSTIITVLDRYLPSGENVTAKAGKSQTFKGFRNAVGQTRLINEDRQRALNSGETTLTSLSEEQACVTDKKPYGEFNNVYLTDNEYERVRQNIPNYLAWVNKLSAYLQQTGKKYEDHYAVIISWKSDDEINRSGSSSGSCGSGREMFEFEKNPSYDLKRAEENARKRVPKIKKRVDPPLTSLQQEIRGG